MEGAGMGDADADELLTVAVDVARQAAALAVARRLDGIGEVGTKSTATDRVTAADRAVERLIVELLHERRPGDEVLGEEYGGGPPARELAERPSVTDPDRIRWVVDPIDGTVNYVYGLPHYAVSVAAEVRGEAVAGVVLDAGGGAEWTAARGGGAWRDGRRLAAPARADLAHALVATGFAYDPA